jgi:hypothetical protein
MEKAPYLQIVTEICHKAQTLVFDPRMKLAREPLVKTSGTCSFPIMGCEGRIMTFLTQQDNRNQHIYI